MPPSQIFPTTGKVPELCTEKLSSRQGIWLACAWGDATPLPGHLGNILHLFPQSCDHIQAVFWAQALCLLCPVLAFLLPLGRWVLRRPLGPVGRKLPAPCDSNIGRREEHSPSQLVGWMQWHGTKWGGFADYFKAVNESGRLITSPCGF